MRYFFTFFAKKFCRFNNLLYLCSRKSARYLSSAVEQWTENPCVPGSIPGGTTIKVQSTKSVNGALVQLVRMPACHAGGRWFESCTHRNFTEKCSQ